MGLEIFDKYWFLIYPVIIWSMVWKGLALWRAARNGQKYWFIAILIINTVGILEIIYFKFFSQKQCHPKSS